MAKQTDKVRLNVGGKIFETTAATLAGAGRSSMLGAMFGDEWNNQQREVPIDQEHFIDRNPKYFSVLLDLLRTGELDIPSDMPENKLYREALYYGLLDHVRTARFCELDGNRLRLTSSVKGQATYGNCTAIRASPDGGCALAHDRIVRQYDWMLEENLTLSLHHQKVNDIGWIDSENIVISARERPGREDPGIGLFSSSRGDLKHTFQLNQAKSFTARALCFNSDGKVFAACSGTGVNGIGVWDQVTGIQTDFFDKVPGNNREKDDSYDKIHGPLCNANRIQCFNGSNCLLVFDLSGKNDYRYISLLDLRDKSTVWHDTPVRYRYSYSCNAEDGIAMEGSNTICVVDEYENMGFMDIRGTNGGRIQWNPDNGRLGRLKNGPRPPCYPKLAVHGGQLYSCTNDRISVFCGPDWVQTSSPGKSCSGGAIRDFSIGGDRLFALHDSEEYVFDVWETPSLPNRAVY